MSDIMRPIPLEGLFSRSFAELRAKGTIFDIPESHFYQPTRKLEIFSSKAATPIGPAAGPHTQLAQNILASYLVGGRYFELKTVQILDSLEIEKPCIDVQDEGYNVEWSSEFSLDKAYDEYLKAWFLLHVFEAALPDSGAWSSKEPSFHFNMSVGYDLEGIKSEKMDRFINRLIDSSKDPLFDRYLQLCGSVDPAVAAGTQFDGRLDGLESKLADISPRLTTSVTLSTMHGCPPDEIEAICGYMLREKKLDTLVKLNPTLLGYDTVGRILSGLGYDYVSLNKAGFQKDLQYADAVPMLKRLQKLAEDEGKFFGVKLSNTLAASNHAGVLPGEEMYVSGRALYPLTINLAALLAGEFGDSLPISFSGGASAWNLEELIKAGVRPITVATDLLKPGGFGRLKQMAEIGDREWHTSYRLSPDKLKAAATVALSAPYLRKEFREGDVSVDGTLPLTDCFVAPCIQTCPISQDVPEYIHLVGEGKYEEAFSVIYKKNPLPFMTGYLCDHACEVNCTRVDWEGAVRIREIKRIAAERGYKSYRESGELAAARRGSGAEATQHRAAVIGAGPAGLAAASFLAREGVNVHVYEREEKPGGVIHHVIPGFRVPDHIVSREVSLLEDLGVEFTFGCGSSLSIDELQSSGYGSILVGIGAEEDRDTGIKGALAVLGFLRTYRKDPNSLSIGPKVAVVGAGDTAMDAARAASRCAGVTEVTVIYRRTMAEMPALKEEYESAVEDGVSFRFLVSPVGWADEDIPGELVCDIMELGEPDAGGRPRPRPTGNRETLAVDTVITAVGEDVDARALDALGLGDSDRNAGRGVFLIGDAQSGASTIVKAIASARKASDAVLARIGVRYDDRAVTDTEVPERLVAARDGVVPVPAPGTDDDELRSIASRRCLGCRAVCLKCVEVCPNRANTWIEVPGYVDRYQIVHLDAFCNECGNCETFCPWTGRPYIDKFTVFNTRADFNTSGNPGIYLEKSHGVLRVNDSIENFQVDIKTGDVSGVGDKHSLAMITSLVKNYQYIFSGVDM